MRHSSIEPLKPEDPANDNAVTGNKNGAYALGLHPLCLCKHSALVGYMVATTDARPLLVLLHRRVLGIELLNRFGVCVLFDARNECFERSYIGHTVRLPATHRMCGDADY